MKNNNKNIKYNKEKIKWIFIIIVLIITIICNYIFYNINIILRILLIFFVAAITLNYIIKNTKKGEIVNFFIKETILELKKIVWPKFKDTLNITILIIIIIILMSLILWILDNIIIHIISFITFLRF